MLIIVDIMSMDGIWKLKQLFKIETRPIDTLVAVSHDTFQSARYNMHELLQLPALDLRNPSLSKTCSQVVLCLP